MRNHFLHMRKKNCFNWTFRRTCSGGTWWTWMPTNLVMEVSCTQLSFYMTILLRILCIQYGQDTNYWEYENDACYKWFKVILTKPMLSSLVQRLEKVKSLEKNQKQKQQQKWLFLKMLIHFILLISKSTTINITVSEICLIYVCVMYLYP